jgi:sialic acid synthase SpsE
MACSHDGSVKNAKKIIDGAIEADADAIQLQMWAVENIVVPDHNDIDKIRSVQLSSEDWKELFNYIRASSKTIEIIACVYDVVAAEQALAFGADAFKVHSADVENLEFLSYLATLSKRIDLSVGSSTFEEIATAINVINSAGTGNIWLMYGKQLFPTNTEDAEIAKAITLKHAFMLPVGYQDHTNADLDSAFWLPIAARGAGILIQEKHITHDRHCRGVDSEAALNPMEFRKFVECIRAVDMSMGIPDVKPFTEAELRYRKYSKKSIVASRNLNIGEIITRDDLLILRTNDLGFAPSKISSLIGKKVFAPIQRYEMLSESNVS